MKHLFPYLLAVLDICACVFYCFQGDLWRAGYWLAAGFLTFSTTRYDRQKWFADFPFSEMQIKT
jgi:hypothetical protein